MKTIKLKLTPRETQIFNLAQVGLSSRVIGEMLGISVRTVETHIANISKRNGFTERRRRFMRWSCERYVNHFKKIGEEK